MTRPNFRTSRAEADLIDRIATRARTMIPEDHPFFRDRMAWHMDLAAAHNACPLKLAELAGADDANFAHDVYGIARHLDRDTGQLTDCFLPRYARHDGETA